MTDRSQKRPAFQWYPGDAQRDTALRSLPLVVRGLWREMLDLMHDGAPYGHLTTAAGAPIAPEALARMVGEPVKKVAAWLGELEAAGVFSRTEAGVIYSRRMVRDEHVRTVRAAAGAKGGNPALLGSKRAPVLVKHPDNQTAKQSPTPAVAVAGTTDDAHRAREGGPPAGATRPPAPPEPPPPDPEAERVRAAVGDDLDTLLARVPGVEHKWVAFLAAALDGAPAAGVGAPLSPDQLRAALSDYLANPEREPNAGRFRGYLRRAAQDRPAAIGATGPTRDAPPTGRLTGAVLRPIIEARGLTHLVTPAEYWREVAAACPAGVDPAAWRRAIERARPWQGFGGLTFPATVEREIDARLSAASAAAGEGVAA